MRPSRRLLFTTHMFVMLSSVQWKSESDMRAEEYELAGQIANSCFWQSLVRPYYLLATYPDVGKVSSQYKNPIPLPCKAICAFGYQIQANQSKRHAPPFRSASENPVGPFYGRGASSIIRETFSAFFFYSFFLFLQEPSPFPSSLPPPPNPQKVQIHNELQTGAMEPEEIRRRGCGRGLSYGPSIRPLDVLRLIRLPPASLSLKLVPIPESLASSTASA